jgi:hypothetical protein
MGHSFADTTPEPSGNATDNVYRHGAT